MRAIGYIAMELMQKYHKDDGAIGLEDFSRYPSDSDAVDFLAATTSATSAEELLRVSSPSTKTVLHFRQLILA